MTYQTHIFVPPVTGAPVRKTKLSDILSMGPIGYGSIVSIGELLLTFLVSTMLIVDV